MKSFTLKTFFFWQKSKTQQQQNIDKTPPVFRSLAIFKKMGTNSCGVTDRGVVNDVTQIHFRY